jgi:hypothetical protein
VRHRSPYSLVDVNDVSVPALIERHRGKSCVLGVDVAKKELVGALVSCDRSFERPWRIASPQQLRLLGISKGSGTGQAPFPSTFRLTNRVVTRAGMITRGCVGNGARA